MAFRGFSCGFLGLNLCSFRDVWEVLSCGAWSVVFWLLLFKLWFGGVCGVLGVFLQVEVFTAVLLYGNAALNLCSRSLWKMQGEKRTREQYWCMSLVFPRGLKEEEQRKLCCWFSL